MTEIYAPLKSGSAAEVMKVFKGEKLYVGLGASKVRRRRVLLI